MFSNSPSSQAPDGIEHEKLHQHDGEQHRVRDGLMDEQNGAQDGNFREQRNVPGGQDAGTGYGGLLQKAFEKYSRDPQRENIDHEAAHDLIDQQVDREYGV